MKLPKIDLPIYDFELPSTGRKIKFRPFLVKEQKILLMALEEQKSEQAESNDQTIIDAVKQIIKNCIVETNFNVNEMSSFDIEYFFLHLRARSISEKVNMSFRCKNTVEDKECNNLMQFEHDILNSTVIEKNPNHNKTIFFTKDVGVVMKYPSFNAVEVLINKNKKNSVEAALDMIINSIDYFFDKDGVYPIKELDKKDILEYIENIPKSSFDKIDNFFNTMPVVKSNIEHKCSKCGFQHVIPLEGLTSFFA